MTRDKACFAELDERVSVKVQFGDGSIVTVHGCGTVLFAVNGGAHRAFTDVFYIPVLKCSVISLGQLDESWRDIRIRRGTLTLQDSQDRLLAKVPRLSNRLYKLSFNPVQPVCLAAQHDSESWRWHAQLGHIHFDALQRMARGGLVRGLPRIEQEEQLCEACLTGKQRHTSFPQQSTYRASDRLDLVHADLCGPIAPATL